MKKRTRYDRRILSVYLSVHGRFDAERLATDFPLPMSFAAKKGDMVGAGRRFRLSRDVAHFDLGDRFVSVDDLVRGVERHLRRLSPKARRNWKQLSERRLHIMLDAKVDTLSFHRLSIEAAAVLHKYAIGVDFGIWAVRTRGR